MGRFAWLVLGATVVLGGCAGDTTGPASAGCTTGSERCACYPNNTCDGTLTCASHLCVSLGTGGSGAGGMAPEPTVRESGGTLGYGGFMPAVGGSMIYPGGGKGGAGGSPSIPGFSIDAGGYVLANTWHGYAWPAGVTSGAAGAATTTIDPANFSAVAAGATELCVSGSIGQASDYGGAAMIAVNVNQGQIADDAGNNPNGVVSIGGSGITVTYSQTVRTEIRIEIQTPAGENDPTGRWCAVLRGAVAGETVTETVTWQQFWGGTSVTTDGCWNSGGNHPPVGTQIQTVGLLVPGGNSAAVPFNFCLQGLAQAG